MFSPCRYRGDFVPAQLTEREYAVNRPLPLPTLRFRRPNRPGLRQRRRRSGGDDQWNTNGDERAAKRSTASPPLRRSGPAPSTATI